jgi:hypothetical protein
MGNNILGPPSNYAAITALQNDKMDKSANLSDVADDVISFGNIKQPATTEATGVVELATDAEVMGGAAGKIPDAQQISNTYLPRIALINDIGPIGEAGSGVGICPNLPDGFSAMSGYSDRLHDNHGNYQYSEGSIMCWVPKFYYKIGTGLNGFPVNRHVIKGIYDFATTAEANAAGYALHRAFIDGGVEKDGFFYDKYKCSKRSLSTGFVASSVLDAPPISCHADHNPIADLTACAGNYYYETINAAHARDGENGAANASSIFHEASIFQKAAIMLLSIAHGQAATSDTYCAWYDGTGATNYPKGCNDNALGDTDDATVSYTTDGYSNCGKTGSGTPFAKTTHNGQNCGIADVNGLMYEINLGVTCIATTKAIEDITSAATPVFTITGHGKSVGDYVQPDSIAQADWTNFKDKIFKIATVPDADTFTLEGAPDTTGYAAYDAVTDIGTCTFGTFYIAKESTAMKDFTSGNSGATDHWGAAGCANMMQEFAPVFETCYPNNGFAQRLGSGANQVLSEAVSGAGWLLAGIGSPKDADGIDVIGTNLFGKDYWYQYIRNELCFRSCAFWSGGSSAGVGASHWYYYRAHSDYAVGLRLACYPEN